MVRSHKGGEGQLLRMVFHLLKFMNTREESKVIIAGQPSVVKECINVIQECKFESVLAIAFLNSMAGYLSIENTSCLVRAISHCSSSVAMQKEFKDYFYSVSLQLLAMHSLGDLEEPSNTLDAEEFMEFSSHAIIGLSDGSFLQLGLKVVCILFDYPGIQGIISKEFIVAFTKLFLESVRVDSEDLIGLFAFLLCNSVQGASESAVRAVRGSDFVSHVLKVLHYTYMYSRASLVGTPGDRQNVYSLSGIRINQYHLYWKGFEETEIVFVLTRFYMFA